jgi:hypothetical protein
LALSEQKGRFARARVIFLTERDGGLVDAVRRMGVANVQWVTRVEEAHALCEAGGADACIVILPRAIPDERPAWTAETVAPGRVPTLLIAEAVTPYIRQAARHAGYNGVIPRGLPPRTLYRCIGALLQASRRVKTARGGLKGAARQPAARFGVGARSGEAWTGKSRLQ